LRALLDFQLFFRTSTYSANGSSGEGQSEHVAKLSGQFWHFLVFNIFQNQKYRIAIHNTITFPKYAYSPSNIWKLLVQGWDKKT
jgi:hypothetical protein